MLLAEWYLATCRTRFGAYTAMQASLLARFLRRGGTLEDWVERLAPAYRRRYGWLCEPVPVRVRSTGEHRVPRR